MKQLLISLVLILMSGYVMGAAPVVSNVLATETAGMVTITYTLSAEVACKVSLYLSIDSGSSYSNYPLTAVTGDVGIGISAGTKQIIWNPADDGIGIGATYKVKVLARENTNPSALDDFILVEGDTFNNGTSNVTISSFYMDRYEVTQADYQAVMGVNPASAYGVGASYPVYKAHWFNAIEYCNRRSTQEGLTPCYSYGTFGTSPNNWPVGWNTNYLNHTNVACNWTASGHRLPTEMEWMFAAKGGVDSQGYTYSGSNAVGDVAWYYENSGRISHSVGTKAANEIGIFDMSGNVGEWVWDIYASPYPSGDQTNPKGAVSGDSRVVRGGYYSFLPYACSVTSRPFYYATLVSPDFGFRICRLAP